MGGWGLGGVQTRARHGFPHLVYNKLFESLFVNFDRSNKSSQYFISLNLKPVHNSKMLRFFWKYSSNVINTYLKFKLIKWRKD